VHARQLASQGAEVVILDIDDLGLEECSGMANNITPFKCDVSDLVDVRKLISKVDKDSSSHFPEYDYPNSQQKE
jgi:NAD(P)-dependent dehydrogenase (short-subunit alcohol dehydrogenase family)